MEKSGSVGGKDFLQEKSMNGMDQVWWWWVAARVLSRTGMIFFFFFEVQLGVCLGNLWVGGVCRFLIGDGDSHLLMQHNGLHKGLWL